MKKYILYCLLVLSTATVFGQPVTLFNVKTDEPTIPRLINNKFDYLELRDKRVSKINCTLSTGGSRLSYQLKCDSDNFIFNEKQDSYGDLLLNRDIFLNERYQPKRIIKYMTTPDGKLLTDTINYCYNNNILSSIVSRRSDNTIFLTYTITSDDHGNPVKMVIKDSTGHIVGVEGAKYDYKNNEYIYTIESARRPGSETLRLISDKNPGTKYNKFGDKALIPLNGNNCRIFEYKYDSFGNWIVRKEYDVVLKDDGGLSNKKLNNTYKEKSNTRTNGRIHANCYTVYFPEHNEKEKFIMNPNRYAGCCGAYCKTCKPFIDGACKGCKIGFDTGERDIDKAKCKIKLCCFRDRNLDTCADCSELGSCKIIGEWYSKNGYKYKKYKEAVYFIKENGYEKFFEIADNWKNAYGKYQ